MVKPKRPLRKRGILLLEVMIALAVVAIAIVGILSVILLGLRFEMAAREHVVAQNAARRIMEQIQGSSSIAEVDGFNNFPFKANSLAAQKGDADGQPGLVTVKTLQPDLREVEVAVDWSGAYPRNRVKFTTLWTPK